MNGEPALDVARLRLIFGESLRGAADVVGLAVGEVSELTANLQRAIAAADASEAANCAHGMKSVCVTIGAAQLARIAELIEEAANAGDLQTSAAIARSVPAARDALASAHRSLASVTA